MKAITVGKSATAEEMEAALAAGYDRFVPTNLAEYIPPIAIEELTVPEP
jgi:hypothetical protein